MNKSAGVRHQVSGPRDQAPGPRYPGNSTRRRAALGTRPGTGHQAPGTRHCAASGPRERAPGPRDQAPGPRDQAPGSRDQAQGSRDQAPDTRNQAPRHKTQAAAIAGILALLLSLPLTAVAQTTTQNVEVDPVTCWWRANVAVVVVGQPFSVVLTCSVLETDAARAVVERSRMGSAAVQFPPYEVVGGTQGAEHVTAGRRFLQYEYIVRLIAEDAFGTDVPINGMEISYRIESRVQQDTAVQGREQTYVLPPLPMRVASLVPDDANHIREAGVPSLGEIATREFRARMLRLIALILFGIAGLTLVLALVRWARQRRTGTQQVEGQLLSNRAVLAGVRQELLAVRQQTRSAGWTPETIARALAAARVVASYMTGRAVVQRSVAKDASIGEISLARAWPVRRRVAVCGTTTAYTLNAARAGNSEIAASDLDAALTQLTSARYGRATAIDPGPLDEAIETAIRAVDRVAGRYTRMAEASASVRESMRGWRPRAWAR